MSTAGRREEGESDHADTRDGQARQLITASARCPDHAIVGQRETGQFDLAPASRDRLAHVRVDRIHPAAQLLETEGKKGFMHGARGPMSYSQESISRKTQSQRHAARGELHCLWYMRRALALGAATAATTAAATIAGHRHAESQRRPLQGCDEPTVSAALSSLRTSGVGVVDGVVDQRLVSAIKATTVWKSMPTSIERPRYQRHRRMAPGADQQRPVWSTSAFGRYHRREETFDESDLKVFERLEARIWPLVEAFFQDDDVHSGMKDIYRSELQVHAARHGSRARTCAFAPSRSHSPFSRNHSFRASRRSSTRCRAERTKPGTLTTRAAV